MDDIKIKYNLSITCLKNIYNHMTDGVLFYANVPVNNIPHNTPEHFYTGLTPVGLGAIIELAGFEIIEIGQWGNYDYLQKIFTSGGCDYTNAKYNNEINCPIITWIFAKKTNKN